MIETKLHTQNAILQTSHSNSQVFDQKKNKNKQNTIHNLY